MTTAATGSYRAGVEDNHHREVGEVGSRHRWEGEAGSHPAAILVGAQYPPDGGIGG